MNNFLEENEIYLRLGQEPTVQVLHTQVMESKNGPKKFIQ